MLRVDAEDCELQAKSEPSMYTFLRERHWLHGGEVLYLVRVMHSDFESDNDFADNDFADFDTCPACLQKERQEAADEYAVKNTAILTRILTTTSAHTSRDRRVAAASVNTCWRAFAGADCL